MYEIQSMLHKNKYVFSFIKYGFFCKLKKESDVPVFCKKYKQGSKKCDIKMKDWFFLKSVFLEVEQLSIIKTITLLFLLFEVITNF